jgi:enoyl-CoA hydratase
MVASVRANRGEIVERTQLRIVTRGAARIVTLDAPDRANVIDAAMLDLLSSSIPQISRDANTYAIVLRASRPGEFCSGFDLQALARLTGSDPAAAGHAVDARCSLVWTLECLSKPVVALIDGAVTGAGAGLTLVNTHRVAGAGYRFSVPGVHMGWLPDAGTAWTLARLPDQIGTYLALTGRSIERADAFALGLVTQCIDEAQFADIEGRLADATTVDPLLDGLHQDAGPGLLDDIRTTIAETFADNDLNAIVARLQAMVATGDGTRLHTWAAGTLADIERAAPLALTVTLRLIREARALDLRQTLARDARLARRLMLSPDFQTAVHRAVSAPAETWGWVPPSRGAVASARIEDLFRPDARTDLELATRQEMQAARL